MLKDEYDEKMEFYKSLRVCNSGLVTKNKSVNLSKSTVNPSSISLSEQLLLLEIRILQYPKFQESKIKSVLKSLDETEKRIAYFSKDFSLNKSAKNDIFKEKMEKLKILKTNLQKKVEIETKKRLKKLDGYISIVKKKKKNLEKNTELIFTDSQQEMNKIEDRVHNHMTLILNKNRKNQEVIRSESKKFGLQIRIKLKKLLNYLNSDGIEVYDSILDSKKQEYVFLLKREIKKIKKQREKKYKNIEYQINMSRNMLKRQ